ncbi:hypothetical protein ACS0TY_012486 [Phlomoides rotata]
MEGGESLLDTLFDEEGIEDGQDVEMLDVEEGELIEQSSKSKEGESSAVGGNQESNKSNSIHKKKKKKKKRKRGSNTDPNVTDINRFVLDACKRLREKKSYLMYTAVGCLGVAALSDLIKEVDAIQACGGQKTADGKRFRNGGGVLWNIIKVRDPNVYKEIMSKGRDFEKQFKLQAQSKQESKQQRDATSNSISPAANQMKDNPSDSLRLMPLDLSQHDPDPQTAVKKRASVHDRIRVPVTYDDLLGEEDHKDELPRPEL